MSSSLSCNTVGLESVAMDLATTELKPDYPQSFAQEFWNRYAIKNRNGDKFVCYEFNEGCPPGYKVFFQCIKDLNIMTATARTTEPTQCLKTGQWSRLLSLSCESLAKQTSERTVLAVVMVVLISMYIFVACSLITYMIQAIRRNQIQDERRRKVERVNNIRSIIQQVIKGKYRIKGQSTPGEKIDFLIQQFLEAKLKGL